MHKIEYITAFVTPIMEFNVSIMRDKSEKPHCTMSGHSKRKLYLALKKNRTPVLKKTDTKLTILSQTSRL